MTTAIIVSVTKMKAINLNKGRSMFFLKTLIGHRYNAQKNKELHCDKKISLRFVLYFLKKVRNYFQ
ncbi:hypothetical protein GGR08_000862 [Bartonella fuyuanensis]|uniref:Uncharacterized protein n=1 Tax=Bartonella fuyuanensis TaxID=1460968 RepID=A0A840DYF8_9HYPH|nr:hypothetical protein [Bartonella fuyuanensis]